MAIDLLLCSTELERTVANWYNAKVGGEYDLYSSTLEPEEANICLPIQTMLLLLLLLMMKVACSLSCMQMRYNSVTVCCVSMPIVECSIPPFLS